MNDHIDAVSNRVRDDDSDDRSDRRGLLRLMAGAAAGAAVATVAGASSASAATANPMLIGIGNEPTAVGDVTGLASPSATQLMPSVLRVTNFSASGLLPDAIHRVAVFGTSSDADASGGFRIGLFGGSEPFSDVSKSGLGVLGTSHLGVVLIPEPTEPIGVFGFAPNGGTGVQGTGDVYGVVGNGNGPTGIGVRALSNSGVGVVATGAGNAINATSVGSGVGISATGVNGVVGTANNTGDGVVGISTSGRGVLATSTSGLDLDCNGTGRVRVKPQTATGAPTSGTFVAGEMVLDAAGDLYACIVAGTPGTWHRSGATAVAPATGVFRPVDPFRAYDSREAAYPTNGVVAAGSSRVVSIADAHSSTGAVTASDVVPVGAVAVTFNLTVVAPTSAGGFLAIAPGGATDVVVSTLNWTAPGVVIANGGTTKLDTDRQVKVFLGGLPGTAHFLVDITGYYL